ncbi:hypothetical protein NDU88_002904 [Pleurodeles waltl]|uniref:Uncharacterized protein n=1 Tax=Pleurodeles waltl TaxID=8319 RepID=A0AAV7WT38_PLEWA|nr:hypothetical protein NDU88_002904 [Pleurodeles waltl]
MPGARAVLGSVFPCLTGAGIASDSASEQLILLLSTSRLCGHDFISATALKQQQHSSVTNLGDTDDDMGDSDSDKDTDKDDPDIMIWSGPEEKRRKTSLNILGESSKTK